jgi:hypothetical protein
VGDLTPEANPNVYRVAPAAPVTIRVRDPLGASWASDLIQNGSGPLDENIRPYVPLNRPAGSDNEMVLFLRGHYDYWDFSRGVGYQTGVQLWTRSGAGTGSLTTGNTIIPEPTAGALLLLAPLLLRRTRKEGGAGAGGAGNSQ